SMKSYVDSNNNVQRNVRAHCLVGTLAGGDISRIAARSGYFFFSSRRRHTRSVSAFLLNRSSDLTRTENILHRNFTRRQVAIQNRVASNIGISQSTFSVKVLNLFSRSRRKTNKRKSKHSAMLRNKETRHRM